MFAFARCSASRLAVTSASIPTTTPATQPATSAARQEGSERTISKACWSTTGESPEYGNASNSSDDNCIRVDGETVDWEQAMNAMNAALEQEGIEWRYALNTGDDTNIRPLILVKQDA